MAGATGQAASGPLPRVPPPTVAPPSGSRSGFYALIIVLVVVIVIVGLLAVIPVSVSYSEELHSSLGSNGTATLSPSQNSHVSGSWLTASGQPVTFQITDATGGVLYTAYAASGSFTFTVDSPFYTFTSVSNGPQTVSLTGAYTSPVFVL